MSEARLSSTQLEDAANEKSARPVIVKSMYAQRVSASFTRNDAETLRKILRRLTGDPIARAAVGMPKIGKAGMNQAVRMERMLDRRIKQRDKRMAAKLDKLGIQLREADAVVVLDERLHSELTRAKEAEPTEYDTPLF